MQLDWTKIALSVIVLTITFFLGWCSKPEPKIKYNINTIDDTTFVHIPYYDTIKVDTSKKSTPINIINYPADSVISKYLDTMKYSVTDSISGIKDSIKYDIHHTMNNDSSFWNIRLEPMKLFTTSIIHRDTVLTPIIQQYDDGWFKAAMVEFAIIVVLFVKAFF